MIEFWRKTVFSRKKRANTPTSRPDRTCEVARMKQVRSSPPSLPGCSDSACCSRPRSVSSTAVARPPTYRPPSSVQRYPHRAAAQAERACGAYQEESDVDSDDEDFVNDNLQFASFLSSADLETTTTSRKSAKAAKKEKRCGLA